MRRVEKDGGAGFVVDAGEVKEVEVRPPAAQQRGAAFAGEDDGRRVALTATMRGLP